MLCQNGNYYTSYLLNCVEQNGAQTVLVDPATGSERPFTFDYSFWSHDGFSINDDGVAVATDDRYAD